MRRLECCYTSATRSAARIMHITVRQTRRERQSFQKNRKQYRTYRYIDIYRSSTVRVQVQPFCRVVIISLLLRWRDRARTYSTGISNMERAAPHTRRVSNTHPPVTVHGRYGYARCTVRPLYSTALANLYPRTNLASTQPGQNNNLISTHPRIIIHSLTVYMHPRYDLASLFITH